MVLRFVVICHISRAVGPVSCRIITGYERPISVGYVAGRRRWMLAVALKVLNMGLNWTTIKIPGHHGLGLVASHCCDPGSGWAWAWAGRVTVSSVIDVGRWFPPGTRVSSTSETDTSSLKPPPPFGPVCC